MYTKRAIWQLTNCSAFPSSHFCVSVSYERRSERIERKFRAQNLSLSHSNSDSFLLLLVIDTIIYNKYSPNWHCFPWCPSEQIQLPSSLSQTSFVVPSELQLQTVMTWLSCHNIISRGFFFLPIFHCGCGLYILQSGHYFSILFPI